MPARLIFRRSTRDLQPRVSSPSIDRHAHPAWADHRAGRPTPSIDRALVRIDALLRTLKPKKDASQ